MATTGPIILIEDDMNDLDLMVSAIKATNLNIPVKTFTGATDALTYLLSIQEQPFVILCDIRMPQINGLEFRNAINANEYLRKKTIPFLFFTGIVSQQIVNEAYDQTVQGFFAKPDNYQTLIEEMTIILKYWKNCLHPNSFV